MDFDTAWKHLFGLPIVVEHLLQGFVTPVSSRLDFGSLQELSASWSGPDREQRHGDAAWRVNYSDGTGRSLVLLLEFQSSVDQTMAVRVQRYKVMAYEALSRQRKFDACGQLRLLPVVIHSGDQVWNAPGGAKEIKLGRDGEILLPLAYSYLSLDVQRLAQHHLPSRNLVATVFELDTLASPADIPGHMRDLSDWLPGVVDSAAVNVVLTTIVDWLAVVTPRMFPGSGAAQCMVAKMQQEVRERENTMSLLAERAKQWEADWLEQGMERGMERGIERGVKRGLAAERELLCHMTERKFNAGTAEALAGQIATVTDTDRLTEVGGWIIDCETDTELLAKTGKL